MLDPLLSPATREALVYTGLSAAAVALALFALVVVGGVTLFRVFIRNKADADEGRPIPTSGFTGVVETEGWEPGSPGGEQ